MKKQRKNAKTWQIDFCDEIDNYEVRKMAYLISKYKDSFFIIELLKIYTETNDDAVKLKITEDLRKR